MCREWWCDKIDYKQSYREEFAIFLALQELTVYYLATLHLGQQEK